MRFCKSVPLILVIGALILPFSAGLGFFRRLLRRIFFRLHFRRRKLAVNGKNIQFPSFFERNQSSRDTITESLIQKTQLKRQENWDRRQSYPVNCNKITTYYSWYYRSYQTARNSMTGLFRLILVNIRFRTDSLLFKIQNCIIWHFWRRRGPIFTGGFWWCKRISRREITTSAHEDMSSLIAVFFNICIS